LSDGAARRLWPLVLGCLVLTGLWASSLRSLASVSFTLHMVLHLGLVLVAAPLLALGVARAAAARHLRFGIAAAVAFSLVEMLVVWAWHIPALHGAAALRSDAFALQQATFLLAGLLVWVPALGSGRRAAVGGAAALVASFVHMTMLGVLLALAPGPIYPAEVCGGALGLDPLADQRLGGALMAVTGGFVYLCGAIWSLARLLLPPSDQAEARPAPEAAVTRLT
jgi:putative membrane protein